MSLTDASQLISLKEKAYTEVLTYGENYNKYNTSLFDLLALRYLQFLKNPTLNPRDQPEKITNKQCFAAPSKFAPLSLKNLDSTQPIYKALKTYQKLTQLHLKENDHLSVVTTTLERLKYVEKHGYFKNPDQLYGQTLKNLQKTYEQPKLQAWVTAKLALHFFQKADKKKHPNAYLKSLKYIQQTQKLSPNSIPAREVAVLEKKIKTQTFR